MFSPALADVLQRNAGELRLSPANPSDVWIYARLSHGIPTAKRTDRVRIVPAGAAADFVVAGDGRITPAR